MKRILDNCARFHTHDGWAIRAGKQPVMDWTFCTTRQEARDLQKTLRPDLFQKTKVVKVRVSLEVIAP